MIVKRLHHKGIFLEMVWKVEANADGGLFACCAICSTIRSATTASAPVWKRYRVTPETNRSTAPETSAEVAPTRIN